MYGSLESGNGKLNKNHERRKEMKNRKYILFEQAYLLTLSIL